MRLSSGFRSLLRASLANSAHGWVVSSVQDGNSAADLPFAGGTVCLSSDPLLMQITATVSGGDSPVGIFEIVLNGSNYGVNTDATLAGQIIALARAYQTAQLAALATTMGG